MTRAKCSNLKISSVNAQSGTICASTRLTIGAAKLKRIDRNISFNLVQSRTNDTSILLSSTAVSIAHLIKAFVGSTRFLDASNVRMSRE
jgi:hypothetical protein